MEKLIIIWLDLNVNEFNDSFRQLRRSIFYSVQTFDESNQCIDFLSESPYDKVFFIVSDSLGQTVVPLVHETHQLYHIYVLGDKTTNHEQNWTTAWKKIKGVFTDISSIIDILRRHIRHREQNSGSISVVPPTADGVDLNELDPSFMYSQLLKEMLLEMTYDEQTKTQFVQFCRDEYADNDATLHAVDNFEREYSLCSPIWWYTKEPFIYVVLNRALRMQNIEIILQMGFFVRDLHQQIKHLHSETNQTANVIVYRGQGLANKEFEKMKKNEGGLLAFNNFLSTSYDEQVSLAFATSSSDDPDLTGIFFRIEINLLIASAPFASLDNISYYSDREQEILFSMHTVFRIGHMRQIQDRLWQVQLILTSDNDEQLKRLTDHIRHDTRGQTGHYRLGTLMMKMGEFEKAELFFMTLIEKTSDKNCQLLAHLYHQLGCVHQNKGNGPNALLYFDKALSHKQKYLSSIHLDFATTYNNIAMVHETMGNYSAALSYYQKTLEIQQQSLPSNHSDPATTYNNIGLVHRSMGDTAIALSCFLKALEIQQKSLPPTHPDLASTYCNIGGIYQFMGNYSTALSYFVKTLDIQQKSLPPTHPHLATAYNNIGMVHDAMGDYSTALSYYQKSLDIDERVLPPIHPDLGMIYSNIATIYYSMEKYSISLEYFKKSVEIQEKIFPPTHPSLAITYNNLGGIYDAMNEPLLALSYYQKTLAIEEKSLPLKHPSLATTYNNIGMAYDTMKDHTTALSYYEKALDIQQNNLPPTHPELATVYNNIGAANYRIGDHSTAIRYYQKALEIREKSLPSTHPDLISLYSNIGVSYRSIGDQSSALIYFEKTLKILEKVLPPNYRLSAAVHYNMAKTFEDTHQYQQAIEHTSRAIEMINQIKESNSPQKQKYQDYLNELQQKL